MLPYLSAPHWGLVNFPFDFNIDLLKVSVIKTNCSSKLVFFAGLQVPIKLPCSGTNGALREVSHGNRKSLGTHTLQFNIFLISLFLLGYLSLPFKSEIKWSHLHREVLFSKLLYSAFFVPSVVLASPSLILSLHPPLPSVPKTVVIHMPQRYGSQLCSNCDRLAWAF